MSEADFQEVVWQQGRDLYRSMPWRDNTEPYWVLVSEIMLQQTQVDRVIPKFEAFMRLFPTIESLAQASLAEVLAAWSGLGYNRRARFLHLAAGMVVQECKGVFPETLAELVKLPGVGPNTAGALLAYSFNQPAIFIETNVRTVYFHHFFEQQDSVSDAELREVVAATIDQEHPREWYWALMDYGSFLKRQGVGRNAKSAHYTKQSALKGSVREVRGAIMKYLTAGPQPTTQVQKHVPYDERFAVALEGLVKEGLVSSREGVLSLGSE